MDAYRDVPQDPQQDVEFKPSTFELLLQLVDLRKADEMMPLGPAAVYTASVVLWLLVFQRLQPSASLEVAVKHLVNSAPDFCPNNKRIREKTLSIGTGSYSDARQRLPLEVAEWFANEVSRSIISTTGPTWGERRVFFVDGTTITLAPEKELQKAFPPASNQYGEGVWPVALLLVAHELESGCALLPEIGPMYGPRAISEVELARTCLQRLPENSIVMGDANFGIFSMAYEAQQTGHSFLLRLTKSRFQSLRKKATLVSQGEDSEICSLRWTPSARERKTNPHLPAEAAIQVRLHTVKVHEKLTLWMVTNLPEDGWELASLYKQRNDLEIDIRNLKVVLDAEHIRARSEVCVFPQRANATLHRLHSQPDDSFRRQAAHAGPILPTH